MTIRISRLTAAAGLTLTLGCSSLTDVDSPDVVQPEQLNNAAGAEALTTGALASIMSAEPSFPANDTSGDVRAVPAESTRSAVG